MDHARIESEKTEEIMLPGFRFHPTDEELVGFYLKRKVQHKPLSIELIKQLDIYKHDPWDLPTELATTGEKEWYFYCPRDRKYRNSARPNRVTGAGFWKATGTDRPIYASDGGSKCIGLKKSLVFYKGRAAKGIKTDWMMHEFRLPSLNDSVSPSKKYLDKNIPANEAWAICRIFKKSSSSNSQRANMSQHSWVSPVFDHIITTCDANNAISPCDFNNANYHSGYYSSKTNYSSPLQFGSPAVYQIENTPHQFTTSLPAGINNNNNDASSLFLEMSSSIFGEFVNNEHCNNGIFSSDTETGNLVQENVCAVVGKDEIIDVGQRLLDEDQLGLIRSMGFDYPNHNYGLPMSFTDAWKSNLVWDSSPCPSELSTSYSTNNCYI
ncbi:hypothetical protein MIMGU_mgv1a022481mg [Erythranthe guttata]|uniref:NAC domain-containing protein n=2 Tax=Erythranthe guttata TaxID=4155 RepID=A0A022Q7D4_ERYGU|nr:hypothetical protein MIMGU_mgv1a022481mg [Erythranthe guttata]